MTRRALFSSLMRPRFFWGTWGTLLIFCARRHYGREVRAYAAQIGIDRAHVLRAAHAAHMRHHVTQHPIAPHRITPCT